VRKPNLFASFALGDYIMPYSGLVFVGPPGSGKGTQALRYRDYKAAQGQSVCHLSTGDILRDAIKQGTELGKQVQPILASGGLVSDDIMVGLVKEALTDTSCRDGFILDGFPRTVSQAEKLDQMLDANEHRSLSKVIDFRVSDETVLGRVLGRLIHKSSGRTYHKLFKPPKVAMTDDVNNCVLFSIGAHFLIRFNLI
jgi:adenylate kinase